jgi:hypothetical protein
MGFGLGQGLKWSMFEMERRWGVLQSWLLDCMVFKAVLL